MSGWQGAGSTTALLDGRGLTRAERRRAVDVAVHGVPRAGPDNGAVGVGLARQEPRGAERAERRPHHAATVPPHPHPTRGVADLTRAVGGEGECGERPPGGV